MKTTEVHLLRRRLLGAGLSLPLISVPAIGRAQSADWPQRPIRVVVGYPAGGAADGTARPLGPKLNEMLGQPIVFDYKPGAGATIAADYTAKAAPDGYTLHFGDSGPITILPNGKKLNYDPLASFTPIGMGCTGGTLLVVHPSVKAQNLSELINLARTEPQTIHYGTSGLGGAGHLAAELLQQMAGITITHVPYKGGNQAISDLVGGQVPVLFSSMATAVPHVLSGKVRAIAVTSANRASVLPDVPTVAEQGLPGFEASIWFAMFGPADLPPEVVRKTNNAMNVALADPAVQDALRRQGYEPQPGTPEDLARQVRSDLEKWGKVIRDADITFS
ncbi:tripartite tricarboxylate transporter substrate binding protein [Alcaligenaceae bacterium]|nr:tripartite tricarboxylate transporter substrate binding protein [Alcaligenaceae bacterium]